MTPTAEELWNDVHFVVHRWMQQCTYLARCEGRTFYSEERKQEVAGSAKVICDRFHARAKELFDQMAREGRLLRPELNSPNKIFPCPPLLPGGEQTT